MSVREIAGSLDVSTATVYRALQHHGIPVEDHPFEQHKPHLAELLTKEALGTAINDERLTVAQIATRYDCSVQTLSLIHI